jgi:hypothetical protein
VRGSELHLVEGLAPGVAVLGEVEPGGRVDARALEALEHVAATASMSVTQLSGAISESQKSRRKPMTIAKPSLLSAAIFRASAG